MACQKGHTHGSHHHWNHCSIPLFTRIVSFLGFILLILGGFFAEGMEAVAGDSARTSGASQLTDNSGHASNLVGARKPQENLVLDNHNGISVDSRNLHEGNPRGPVRVELNPIPGENVESDRYPLLIPPKEPKKSWIKRQWRNFTDGLEDVFSFNWLRRMFHRIWHGEGPHQSAWVPHNQVLPHEDIQLYPRGHYIDPKSVPFIPVQPHNRIASQELHTAPKLLAALPSSSIKTQVDYLPGQYIRTHDYILPGHDSIFRVLAEIKYKDQHAYLKVKEEIYTYMRANPEKFGRWDRDGCPNPTKSMVTSAFAESNSYNIAFVSDTKPYVSARRFDFNPRTHESHGIILNNNIYELLSEVHRYNLPDSHPSFFFPPGHLFPPNWPISVENTAFLPATWYSGAAYGLLQETPIKTKLPPAAFKTQVDYLPGRHIRTSNFIKQGPNSLFRALSEIKYQDQAHYSQVMAEVYTYMIEHRKMFRKQLHKNEMEYEEKVYDYIYGLAHDGIQGVHDELCISAFSKCNNLNMIVVADTKPNVYAQHFTVNERNNGYYAIILDNHNYELLTSV